MASDRRGEGLRAPRDGDDEGEGGELAEQQAAQALRELRGSAGRGLGGREASPGLSGGAAGAGLAAYRAAAARSEQGGGLGRARLGPSGASGRSGSGHGDGEARERPQAARGSQGGSGRWQPESRAHGAPSQGAAGFVREVAARRPREQSPGHLESEGRRVRPRPSTPAAGGMDSGDDGEQDDGLQLSGHGESEMEGRWGVEGGDFSSLTGQHMAQLGEALRGGYVAGQRRHGGGEPRGLSGGGPETGAHARSGGPQVGHSTSGEPVGTAAPGRPPSVQLPSDRARRVR